MEAGGAKNEQPKDSIVNVGECESMKYEITDKQIRWTAP